MPARERERGERRRCYRRSRSRWPLHLPPKVPLNLTFGAVLALHVLRAGTGGAAEPASVGAAPDALAAPAEPIEVLALDDAHPPIAAPRDRTAAAFTLRREALEGAGRSVAEALRYVPGVEVTRSGSGADLATASLRGASSAETPVYLAGIRLNDDVTGNVDLSTLPAFLIDRVEVYCDAPAGADRLGIGGALFFEPRLPSGTSGRVLLGAGSFGARELGAFVGVGAEKASAGLFVRHGAGDGDFPFLDDGGTRFDAKDDVVRRRANAWHQELDVWTLGRVRVPGGELKMIANATSRDAGAPGLQLIAAERAQSSLRRLVGGLAGSHAMNGAPFGVEWQLDGLATRYGLDDPSRELGPARDTFVDGGRLRERAILWAHPTESLSVGLGASQESERISVTRDADELSARRHLVRGEAQLLAQLDTRADASLVVAGECHTTWARGPSEACGAAPWTGKLGARVRLLPFLDARANLGRYVRVPTLGELYGVSATAQGNDALVPERGIAFDVGLAAKGRVDSLRGYVELVGFARDASELVAFRRTSFGVVRPYNVGAARILGLELAMGGTFAERVDAAFTATLLEPRDRSVYRSLANDLVPFHSRATLGPMLAVHSPPWRTLALDRASLSARYAYRSERVADPAGLIVIPSQGSLELELVARVAHDRAVVRGRMANVLDAPALDLVGFPLPGRSVHGNLEVAW